MRHSFAGAFGAKADIQRNLIPRMTTANRMRPS